MPLRIGLAVGFLILLRLLWPALAVPENTLDGWMFAAYGVVFATLAAYRAGLGARGRELARRAERPAPPGGALTEMFEQLSLVALPMGLVLSLAYAPQEKTMGMVQRIFYVHVPSAWTAFLAFSVVAVASLVYLYKRSPEADRVARASAEVGVVFTSLVLITGPIWAKPVWGIWWTWDARLTLTLVLWLVYIGYLMLRAYVPDPGRRATLAATTGILGAIGVYVDYMAIRWWRTQHPQPVIAGGEGSGLEHRMFIAFLYMLGAFTLMYLALLFRRIEIARLEEEVSG